MFPSREDIVIRHKEVYKTAIMFLQFLQCRHIIVGVESLIGSQISADISTASSAARCLKIFFYHIVDVFLYGRIDVFGVKFFQLQLKARLDVQTSCSHRSDSSLSLIFCFVILIQALLLLFHISFNPFEQYGLCARYGQPSVSTSFLQLGDFEG